MTTENYRVRPIVQPTGAVIALDLLATVTASSGTVNGGVIHVVNSVPCHVEWNSGYETQVITTVVPTAGVEYTLTVDGVVLASGALGASPTLNDLVTALQADGDYAAAPFTIAAYGTDAIKVTWKALATVTDTAVLIDDGAGSYTNTRTVIGRVVTATCQLLMAGERTFVIPGGYVFSFLKSAGASDGLVRVTYCE